MSIEPKANKVRTNLLSDVSNLGFYSIDTKEPCNDTLRYDSTEAILYSRPSLYWHQDTLHKLTLLPKHQYWWRDSRYYVRYVYHIKPSITSDMLDNADHAPYYWGLIGGSNTCIYYDYPITTELFFIPLKDGGFIINTKIIDYTGSSAYREYTNPTIPFKIMPRNKQEGNSQILGINTSVNESVWYQTLIGIPPVNKSAINNYIYIISSYNYGTYYSQYCTQQHIYNETSTWTTDTTPIFDFQKANLSTSSVFKMHKQYNRQDDLKYNKEYMNFIPNVCILSKVPYDNGFIDNIYYMTTCPTASISDDNYRGIFFSFNGRNFINIYGNMVLELPSY